MTKKSIDELLKEIFPGININGFDALSNQKEEETGHQHPDDCLCGLTYDADGISESMPVTDHTLSYLRPTDMVRFMPKADFCLWSEIDKEFVKREYFGFQVKKRAEEKVQEFKKYYFLSANKIEYIGQFTDENIADKYWHKNNAPKQGFVTSCVEFEDLIDQYLKLNGVD